MNEQKGEKMNFFQKLGKVLANNLTYTIVFVVSFILFLYFAEGNLIGGILTAVSALIAYISASLIYQEYKRMPKSVKKASKKK